MSALRILMMVLAFGLVAPELVRAETGEGYRETASATNKAKKKKKEKKKVVKKAKKKAVKKKVAKKNKRGTHASKPEAAPSAHDMAPAGAQLPPQSQGDDLPKPSTNEED